MIKKILIVDDQSSILAGLTRALHKYCDYHGEVTGVETGRKALTEISSCFYDICFLDMNLPDMNGLDVMETIHALSPETKVVIMTAEFIEDDIKEKIENGSFLFIPKPIELDTVKALILSESSGNGDLSGDGPAGTRNAASFNGDKRLTDKRCSERRPGRGTVSYSMSVFYNWELKSDLKADIIDMSAEGIGLITSYTLYPGNVLRFDSSLENRSGIVKWSAKNEKGCRAGVRFI